MLPWLSLTCCPPIILYSPCPSFCFDFYCPILSHPTPSYPIPSHPIFLFHPSLIVFILFLKILLNLPPFPPAAGTCPPFQTARCKGLSSSPACCYIIHHIHMCYIPTYIRALSIVPKRAARSALQGSACVLAAARHHHLLPAGGHGLRASSSQSPT
ncbi:hypothetical protein M441DRAFT_300776 [Trichoderma asperellum CBS 433.97]|uniref:Uncharacterized protein n=1 Tax=Trichoderma asperellum (strain ATCC 204424 / CBS 433.97 / NBRC 101777) TaxID=1042311 RepID=A0A2T3ZJA7_TRIA4|nr:hypothetical protein M441DRAFT_300776 [Trichoderma asperellum CBS 433.97]PTB44894.1 hypothetical protein M441DRAFT_300776 [Trichoderma asperellum CBS 433.97]